MGLRIDRILELQMNDLVPLSLSLRRQILENNMRPEVLEQSIVRVATKKKGTGEEQIVDAHRR